VAFCCTGCALVHRALEEAGLRGTYYRLRELGRDPGAARPVPPDSLAAQELDSPAFLSRHTRPLDAGLREVELFVDGVHCAACVWLVERMPYELDGVTGARLDLPRARAMLAYDPARVRLSDVAAWLARFGYAARPAREAGVRRRTDAERALLVRMGITWAIAGNIMLLAAALYSGLDADSDAALATAARWMSLVLAVPAVAYGGRPFVSRAWASVGLAWRARDPRRLHMDTPVALGVLAGFGHSTWATVSGRGEVWFDSIAVLIAALLTARWLQLRSRRFAGEATERLLALVPTMARRVAAAGAIEVVPIDELRRGDVVDVPAGEVVPVDGEVVSGDTRLDVAVLTGESRPVPVGAGAHVEAGATNISSPLRVRVEAAGEATRVGRLMAWVRDAENRRAPIVLLADRLGGWFVLAVLSAAAMTAAMWAHDPPRALAHVAALLVVTCPCALSMATPLSMAIAAGRAARRGIFVKTDEATQRVTEVDTVVLDKTGTLTEGRMAVAAWSASEPTLDLVAALEAHATHPIAEAIVRTRGVDAGLAVSDIEATPGCGIRGRVAGHDVIVGRPGWVGDSTPGGLPEEVHSALEAWGREGYTPVAIAIDGRAAGLAVGDTLRADAVALVRTLERRGVHVHVLSGDDATAVAAVAGRLGLPASRAAGGVSPEAKRDAVQALQAEGRVVLMVGDGVNDAAALRQADVGVAVGGGTTASLVAADVFLTRPGLAPLAELVSGSSSVMRTIRRTLALSLAYNLAGAVAAMAGLVSPLVAAVAMPVSSIAVVAMAVLQPSFRSTEPAER
jgi:Cu2+-exporting ATPase